jgi:hypothetical protein
MADSGKWIYDRCRWDRFHQLEEKLENTLQQIEEQSKCINGVRMRKWLTEKFIYCDPTWNISLLGTHKKKVRASLKMEAVYSFETLVTVFHHGRRVRGTYCLHLQGRPTYGTQKKLRGLQSASELYRPSDRRLSAMLVPTFVDRGCSVVSATDPHCRWSHGTQKKMIKVFIAVETSYLVNERIGHIL